MKYHILAIVLSFFTASSPSEVDENALRREITYIERAADELARLNIDVADRLQRRRIASKIDAIYEATERIRLLLDQDTVPKSIRDDDLISFIESLGKASFGDTKVDMVKEFAGSNWFTVSQVGLICEEIPFGENKVEAILALYPHIVDKENGYKLYEFVTFSDDRERLKKGLEELKGN